MSRKYTFHYLALSHLPCTATYMSCAYTQKVRKLSLMLANAGHHVYLYGAAHTDLEHPNIEWVPLITLGDIKDSWGKWETYNKFELGYDHATGFNHDLGKNEKAAATMKFLRQAAIEVNRRKKPDHFLLLSMGTYHAPAANKIGLFLTCEPGIGYTGSWTQFKAFESHFLMSYTYGRNHPKDIPDASFYDRVIPNYFNLNDFTFREKPSGDYLCYVGRVIWRKGVDIAVRVAEVLGKKLIVAGQGNEDDFKKTRVKDHPNVEYVGVLGAKERDELMGNALVGLVPTRYMEPFGGVAVEFQACGSPVVTTNFGAFPETVRHGVTGYRADTLRDFVAMTEAAMDLDRRKARSWATRYSCESVYPLFEKWWDDLYEVYLSTEKAGKRSRGWNELSYSDVKGDDMTAWEVAQKAEAGYWANLKVFKGETIKQLTYKGLMGVPYLAQRPCLEMRVLDIGGGPMSMLLQFPDMGRRVIVDPMPLPEWAPVLKNSGIEIVQKPAEEYLEQIEPGNFDEVWMYNCAQHVEDAQKLINLLARAAPVIRVFEWLDIPTDHMHLHTLTVDHFKEYADRDHWKRHQWCVGELQSDTCRGRFIAFHVERKV